MILFFLYLRRCAYFSAIKSIKIQYRKQQNKKIKISPINPNSFSYLLRTPAKMESPQVTYENESSHLIIFFIYYGNIKSFLCESHSIRNIFYFLCTECVECIHSDLIYTIFLSLTPWQHSQDEIQSIFFGIIFITSNFFFYFHLVVVICEWNILMKNILKEKTWHFFCMIPRCRCAIQFISLSLARFFFNRRMRFYNFRFEEYLNSEDGNNRENRTHWFAFNCNLMCFSLLYCK